MPYRSPLVAVVGAGLYEAAPPTAGGSVMVVDAVVSASGVRLVSRAPKVEQSMDLSAASVVIGVGRGIGSVENVDVAAGVAKAIGAQLACSRPIAEGVGWIPKSRHLGVSGEGIQPDVYPALGVSGQVQHMVGVNSATTIVAINKDKSAPIFHHCDLGLVADLSAVLPTLTDQLGQSNFGRGSRSPSAALADCRYPSTARWYGCRSLRACRRSRPAVTKGGPPDEAIRMRARETASTARLDDLGQAGPSCD